MPSARVPLTEAAGHLPSLALPRGLHCPALEEPSFMPPGVAASSGDVAEPCKDRPLLSPAPGFQVLKAVTRKTRCRAEKARGHHSRGAGLEGSPGGWHCGHLTLGRPRAAPAGEEAPGPGQPAAHSRVHPLCLCRCPAPRKAAEGTETATELGRPWARSRSRRRCGPRHGLATSGTSNPHRKSFSSA